MKRKIPTASLDQFFSIQKDKKSQTFETVIPIQKMQLSVVKSQTKKNITKIVVPSLSDDPVDIESICKEKMTQIKEGIHLIFYDPEKTNFHRIFEDVEFD